MTETSPWWDYLQRKLDERAWGRADLARAAGFDRSLFTGWQNGRLPSVPNARAIAQALNVPLLEVLVAAGVLTEVEASLREPELDPRALSNDALIAELRRRVDAYESARRMPTVEEMEADPERYASGGPGMDKARHLHSTPKDA